MPLLLPLLLAGCKLVITAGEHDIRLDADQDGHKDVAHGGDDCDDADATVHPGADELCNEIDDDCDESVDEDPVDPVAWALDGDGDGFPGPLGQITACTAPDEDYVAYGSVPDDCDDSDPVTYPGAPELCDGVDQDCDQDIDEGVLVDGWLDSDGDGWGDGETSLTGCDGDEGFAVEDGDCDDGSDDRYPGAEEICGDDIDQDCDERDVLCPDQALRDVALQGEGGAPSDRFGHALDAMGPLAAVGSPTAFSGNGGAWLLPDPVGGALDASDAPVYLQGLTAAGDFGAAVALHPELLPIGRPTLVVAAPDLVGGTIFLFDVEDGSASTSGDAAATLTSSTLTGSLGTSLRRAGDLDEDGRPDLLVGDQSYDGRGAVWLVPGPIESSGVLSDDLPRLVGQASGDDAGRSVATSDVDGDGIQDVITGAWLAEDTRGHLYVVHGPLAAGTTALEDADHVIAGERAGDLLGYPVASGGDVDGDGLNDVAVMAIGLEPNLGARGLTYLFTGLVGGGAGPSGVGDAIARIQQVEAIDTDSQDGLGLSLAGDVDGDGRAELVVGHPNHEETGHGFGALWQFHGPIAGSLDADAADYAWFGDDNYGEAGFAATLDDVDSDGRADLLLTDPGVDGQRGALYLVPGALF